MERPSIEAPKDQAPPYPHQRGCQSCVAGWMPRRVAPVRHRPRPLSEMFHAKKRLHQRLCLDCFNSPTPPNLKVGYSCRFSCPFLGHDESGHRPLLIFSVPKNHTTQKPMPKNKPMNCASRRRHVVVHRRWFSPPQAPRRHWPSALALRRGQGG